MAVLVNVALGGGIGAAIVIGLWLLASLGDDLRREVRRSERQPLPCGESPGTDRLLADRGDEHARARGDILRRVRIER
ncbi:MAG: hypothetical protein M3P18_16065 [Actinomycetota bacterium]|nr:hypothetical protein [Actinomycetota bacterium]